MGLEIAAAVSAISAIGGAATSVVGMRQASAAQAEMAAASARAEDARKRQMMLESARQQRETIRKMQFARAAAIDAGAQQGASYGSGVAGGTSSLTAQTGAALNYNMQATDIGSNIFDANKDYAGAQRNHSIGSSLEKLGGVFMTNAVQIGKQTQSLNSLFRDPWNTTTTKASFMDNLVDGPV